MKGTPSAHPIVGVGASAGGVEALEHLFRHIPSDTGCAFVVVTHLAPDRRSLLPEIVSRYSEMPVQEAMGGLMPEPNHIYILPADAIVEIEDRKLVLRAFGSQKRERKIIDIFLAALAEDIGERAIGIILSGGDGDGALGIKAIRERGGLTLAQAANGTAPQYSAMPQAAIATGMVDFAIPAEEMGPRIAEFVRGLGTLEALEASGRDDAQRTLRETRNEICAILRKQIGHDFAGYKEKTFLRRVERRMQLNRLETVTGYLDQLRQDPQEVGALFRDLLIHVTNFFRDADAFDALSKTVIPKLFEGRGAEDSVRVWVPGCATGEEVYSIAILMREHMDKLTALPKVQIFATDIDDAALGVARAGRYPKALMDSVSDDRRKRFFTYDDGTYVLTKSVRDLCVFSPHSVIRDPPFSRLDLISCRNLLIYFGADVQAQVIPTFHYALRPGGFLFVGTSENLSRYSELFAVLDKKSRLFRSREDAVNVTRISHAVNGLKPAPFAHAPLRANRELAGAALRHAVEGHVLEHYSPPHVVVNRDGDIVYYSSHTGKYLEPMAGVPTRQLLTLAKKGLRLDLRTVLREAVETEQRVVREGVSIETDDGQAQVLDLLVEPLSESNADERLFLIIFGKPRSVLGAEDALLLSATPEEAVTRLERELRETRERLQSLIEEYETALEELKSSNEELVSVNEELQSTNEELEASKEELQSVNEELHTVNAELNNKVDALDHSNADLANLFASTNVATVFLARDLTIRSYTPAMSQFFNMLPGDRGRPLTDLSSRISLPSLVADVGDVFASGKILERTISKDGGDAHYLMRLAPYQDVSQETQGAVLSFVDVTTLTKVQAHQQILIAELNHRVKNMLAVVISIAEQTHRTAPDPGAFKDRFIERVRGMAQSYELLSRQNWTAAHIGELAKLQLRAFGLDRVTMSNEDIRLPPRQALSLGMILHELATNAVKYGSLNNGGRVDLQWQADGSDVVLQWAEHGGPPVKEPNRQGLGLKLVTQETAYSLKGKAETSFTPNGFRAILRFPMKEMDGE